LRTRADRDWLAPRAPPLRRFGIAPPFHRARDAFALGLAAVLSD
jgi:hypothetical protein